VFVIIPQWNHRAPYVARKTQLALDAGPWQLYLQMPWHHFENASWKYTSIDSDFWTCRLSFQDFTD
jgi:hypothetical protein